MGIILAGRNGPNPETPKGFDDLLEQLRKLPLALSVDKSTSDVAVEFYEETTWDLNQIQTILTPRVIQNKIH